MQITPRITTETSIREQDITNTFLGIGNMSSSKSENEIYKVNKVFEYKFPIFHSIIKVSEGIKAIIQKTFPH